MEDQPFPVPVPSRALTRVFHANAALKAAFLFRKRPAATGPLILPGPPSVMYPVIGCNKPAPLGVR